jgi:hypothetical protein
VIVGKMKKGRREREKKVVKITTYNPGEALFDN